MSELGCIHFITLTQPWATLMAIGEKRVETRGRSTKFRGPLGIHAALGFPEWARDLCYEPVFAEALAGFGYHKPEDLPRGEVLAVVELYDCQATHDLRDLLSWREKQFGDYSSGRFGYLTKGARRLREPLIVRGSQVIPARLPAPILESQLL